MDKITKVLGFRFFPVCGRPSDTSLLSPGPLPTTERRGKGRAQLTGGQAGSRLDSGADFALELKRLAAQCSGRELRKPQAVSSWAPRSSLGRIQSPPS